MAECIRGVMGADLILAWVRYFINELDGVHLLSLPLIPK